MPPERLETLFSAITFAIEECRRIFPAGWREKFFWIFGHKKRRKPPFYGGLRLAGCLFQSGCMTIRRGAFNVT